MKMVKNNQELDQSQGYMAQRRQILNENSSFYVREAYKTLRTNILFALPDEECKKFCITSSMAGEGKSITILNLAISFGETGKKVLLIDADMRRPALARLLIEKATPGLSNLLVGLCTEQEAIRRDVYPNLDVLFSGDIPPNPSELLSSDSMAQFIEKMSAKYDYILVDTPPVDVVSDTCVVANFLDGVLYLARQNRAEKAAVARGINQLQLAGVKILGFVFNGVETYRKKYSEYAKDAYMRLERNTQDKGSKK